MGTVGALQMKNVEKCHETTNNNLITLSTTCRTTPQLATARRETTLCTDPPPSHFNKGICPSGRQDKAPVDTPPYQPPRNNKLIHVMQATTERPTNQVRCTTHESYLTP